MPPAITARHRVKGVEAPHSGGLQEQRVSLACCVARTASKVSSADGGSGTEWPARRRSARTARRRCGVARAASAISGLHESIAVAKGTPNGGYAVAPSTQKRRHVAARIEPENAVQPRSTGHGQRCTSTLPTK